MKYVTIDYAGMTANLIGDQGISQNDFNSISMKITKATEKINNENLEFRKLPYEDMSDIIKYGQYIRENFESFLLLGIGGSALGPKALFKSLCTGFHNDANYNRRNIPRCYFEDNVDPDRFYHLLETLDLSKTCINIISKSGRTIETLSQMMIVIDKLQKIKPNNWTENIVFTTDENSGVLIEIAKKYNIKTFFIPKQVGGRFCLFTPVGMLTAAVCGCDIQNLLKGARDMNERCKNKEITVNPAFMYAILQYLSMKNGKNISIMMPYTDSLKFITDWFSQLWAESLGKRYDIDGKQVNVGQTPVRALGSVDQHSQLQLYLEGPFDKVVTLINVEQYRHEVKIPNVLEDIKDIQFLAGSSLNKLINSELQAVIYALTQNNRPNIVINMPEINEYYIGQLFIMLEIATVYAGYLLNINPFDQPGVEHGKISTYALMGKEGYEQRAKELKIKNQVKFRV